MKWEYLRLELIASSTEESSYECFYDRTAEEREYQWQA